jgi:hypothetical protein
VAVHPQLTRAVAIAACVLTTAIAVLAISGCTSAKHSNATKSTISVEVRVTTYDPRSHKQIAHRYSLDCDPISGSLPFAQRLCADIARHPISMLSPGRSRSVCLGPVFGPVLSVSGTLNGHSSSFSGEPACDWPGGTALAIYWAASTQNTQLLTMMEPRLRCDDDPKLLAMPAPWASIAACVHGLWTPRSERLIRVAEQVAPLAGLNARQLFPHDIGVQRCAIHAGGLGLRTVSGRCGVKITQVWGTPRVTFTEEWPGGRHVHRHHWRVTIAHGIPHLASQSGDAPPQFSA